LLGLALRMKLEIATSKQTYASPTSKTYHTIKENLLQSSLTLEAWKKTMHPLHLLEILAQLAIPL
jgi:hypothetical protein